MKKIIFVFMFVLITSNLYSYTPDPWTTQDTILQSAFTIMLTLDFWQTYTFLYKDKYYYKDSNNNTTTKEGYQPSQYQHREGNPILGESPSKVKFWGYVGISFIGNLIISYILPTPFRTIWQLSGIMLELYCVNHNYQAGIKIGIASF